MTHYPYANQTAAIRNPTVRERFALLALRNWHREELATIFIAACRGPKAPRL